MTSKEKLAKIEYILKGIPVSKEQKDAIKDILNDASNDKKDYLVYKVINGEFYIEDILIDPVNYKLLYKHIITLKPIGTLKLISIENGSIVADMECPYFITLTNIGISVLMPAVDVEIDGGGGVNVEFQSILDLHRSDYEE
jgi:hypothetical protein